jgi:predicted enzyme related to lactoylglutathione lyase
MDFEIFASLPAADLARAQAWYEENLGLTPTDTSETGTLWYVLGDTGFMLYESQFAGSNQATAAALAVKDFDAAVDQLKGRGVAFEDYDLGEDFQSVDGIVTSPDGTRAAWFKDSEGNILGIGTDPRD